jgi:hypothetical protein
VDRVGVKSAPVVVFVKDPGLEPVIYHGMNCLPSLPLLILWSSFKKNSNSLRCSTQSSQGQHFIISFVLCNCFFLRSCDPKLWQFEKSSQFLQPMAHMQFLNAFVVVCLSHIYNIIINMNRILIHYWISNLHLCCYNITSPTFNNTQTIKIQCWESMIIT